ncbi:hypothetical protein AUJ68_00305 [Candidatus Woesearchaeota archaeon CG1_02_57_44]|nr:MAG: hypothetical protein AUJ68_00305 [Candidatus Woesearchaeota archaeon CG1_02_57_44]
MTVVTVWLLWRHVWFFRNPKRTPAETGRVVLSPADGKVIYIRCVAKGAVPVSVKRRRSIALQELVGSAAKKPAGDMLVVGIFMSPFDVHYQRAPIAGRVDGVWYTRGTNLPMTATWMRSALGLRPYERGASHLFTNERNTVLFSGERGVDGRTEPELGCVKARSKRSEGVLRVWVVQIADLYVRRIVCKVHPGVRVRAGESYGLIRMGSQVDVVMPARMVKKMLVAEGDRVRAGETVLATY